MSEPLDWAVERETWPHADASTFHEVGGMRWHVQQMGEGPPVLLLHGTGASSHSWRGLIPLLARRFHVTAPDLPGHGFTQRGAADRLSLPGMAASIRSLLDHLALRPRWIIGHSAGAAIGIRCCLDGSVAPDSVIGINAALLPFQGAAGVFFPPLAKLLFLNPLTPRLFARSAGDRDRIVRLIRGTGSSLDARGNDLYARLFANVAHVRATLGMMANWDLLRFKRDLSGFTVPLCLMVGENDRTIRPSEAGRVREMVPDLQILSLPGLGHLAHEEDAETVAARIFEWLAMPEEGAARVGVKDSGARD